MKSVIVSVTKTGDDIAKTISSTMECYVYTREMVVKEGINNIARSIMGEFQNIIFISSTGIAIRSIAPYIKSKDKDPAVIVIDSSSKYVISLLSGHIGGANDLTIKVADIIKAQPIITTATDNLGILAPDIIAKKYNLVIEDLKKAKDVSAKLVHGEKVIFLDEEGFIKTPSGYLNLEEVSSLNNKKVDKNDKDDNEVFFQLSKLGFHDFLKKNNISGVVAVTNKSNFMDLVDIPVLKLIRKNIVVGIGCRKNYDKEKMLSIVRDELEKLNIDLRAINSVATVEVKRNETAIRNLSEILNAKLKIFSIQDIRKVQHKYRGSDFVEKTIGARCVCEPCVELAGGETFLMNKLSKDGMTCAIGKRA
ncbi:cobalt-precorrin 5A hydrolase [Clostridium sp. KNHs214]|uniref:cobalt-precorrin 5A hydrolase n=1 Tax=Clostridium sp. KNHs214 TaxID=1540257 RepID=UPI000556A8D5|nr:cobalt-precorrin 5A hydrolase [Clostridium sp. KNHs214]